MKLNIRHNRYRKMRYYEFHKERFLILMSIAETLVWCKKMKPKLIRFGGQ